MDIPLNEVIYFDAISNAPSFGAIDADSTPTFEVFEESTDTDMGVGGSMTKRTSKTGNYRGSFTASAANGFELGKWYAVIGTATIGGVACKGIIKQFRIIAAENTAGYPPADTVKVGGTTQTARDVGLALPAAAPAATGGLPILSAGGVLNYSLATLSGPALLSIWNVTKTDVGLNASTLGSLLRDYLTGDAYARIGSNGSGLTDLATAAGLAAIQNHGNETWSTATGFATVNPDNVAIAAIKSKTDNLPADPADASDIVAAFATVNNTLNQLVSYVDTEVGQILNVIDKLDTMLVASGFNWTYTVDAMKNAPAGEGGDGGGTTVYFTPIVGMLTRQVVKNSGVTEFAQWGPLPYGPIIVVDAEKQPVDLSGETVHLTLESLATEGASVGVVYVLANGDGGKLTVNGDDNNYVGTEHATTPYTDVAGDWRWGLRIVTQDNAEVASGIYRIASAAKGIS